jgi:hypothetical protein
MSSYVGPAQNYQYQLPFASEAVPSSFKSNLAPRVLNCSLTTVNVPSTSGNAAPSGLSTIQVPLGQGAYMVNPYLRFKVTNTGVAAQETFSFKGGVSCASALISSYQTTLNSTIIDNCQNAGLAVYDTILAHGTSADWLAKDAKVLMGADRTFTIPAGAGALTSNVFCIPLIGLLGAQQAFPLWACQGTLQININWGSLNASFESASLTGAVSYSEVALVYDRISVESDFISKMRADMMAANAKYVYNYTNYQIVQAPTVNGQSTINTGLNVSSLRGVVLTTTLASDATTLAGTGKSLVYGLGNFNVTLDGRNINNNVLDAVNAPPVVFAEMQKCFNKVFDASVTDACDNATYLTDAFAAGVSASRVAEGLAFQGSPVSVVGCQITQTAATGTNTLLFISDYSLVIGADGAVDLVR